ncbi:MAG: hypothetical protein SNJ57_10475, partial [Cyanobacteriota bacterium]
GLCLTKRSKIAPNMVLLPLMHRFAVPILAELDLDVSHLERAGLATKVATTSAETSRNLPNLFRNLFRFLEVRSDGFNHLYPFQTLSNSHN